MRAMHRPMLKAMFVASACVVAACSAQAQGAAPSDEGVLVHRFTLPAEQAWGMVTMELSPDGWRVGHADGPPPSEAQLRSTLGALAGIEVGVRCAGWVEGPTSYPCGFAVRDLDLAGTVPDRYAAVANDWAPDPQRAAAAVNARPPGIDGSGLIAPVLDSPRFVSLRAPLRYLGDKGVSLGGRLQFEIRAMSNALVPSKFERDSGLVILRAALARPI